MSVDEFETALNSYVASYESPMNTAKSNYEQAQADKSEVNAAQENVNSSKKAYDEANAKVEKLRLLISKWKRLIRLTRTLGKSQVRSNYSSVII